MNERQKTPLYEGSGITIDDRGNLNSSWDYVDYEKGTGRVTMDGTFDAQELRAIADYMDKHDS